MHASEGGKTLKNLCSSHVFLPLRLLSSTGAACFAQTVFCWMGVCHVSYLVLAVWLPAAASFSSVFHMSFQKLKRPPSLRGAGGGCRRCCRESEPRDRFNPDCLGASKPSFGSLPRPPKTLQEPQNHFGSGLARPSKVVAGRSSYTQRLEHFSNATLSWIC